jgi:hypothetical protein
MDLQGFLQIGLLISLWILPSVLVALLVRLTPLYRLSQRSRRTRLAIIAGSRLLNCPDKMARDATVIEK